MVFTIKQLIESDVPSNGMSDSSPVNLPAQTVVSKLKLPVIDIPKFAGDYSEWLPFHDAFSSLIHNNSALNNIQNFQYLCSALMGSALKTIEFIAVALNNYDLAWVTIEERFKNPRIINIYKIYFLLQK